MIILKWEYTLGKLVIDETEEVLGTLIADTTSLCTEPSHKNVILIFDA